MGVRAVAETLARDGVDVHTHFFPAGLNDAAVASSALPSLELASDGSGRGVIVVNGRPFRPVGPVCWDPVRRIERMDRDSVGLQVLSPVPVSLVGDIDARVAARWARRHNVALSQVVADHPSRFAALGMVPLQDVDLAIAELQYIRDALGLPGVEIGTTCAGRELDDAALLPFFEAAEALDVAIFVHPNDGGGAIRRAGRPYQFGLGLLTDTAMAATALVFGGVLDRFPRLRIALAHGCGTFVWALPRLVRGTVIGGPPADAGAIKELVARLWVDALVFEPAHLPLLVSHFGARHVMLGSDFPFYDRSWGEPAEVIAQAAADGLIGADEAQAMVGVNARTFLTGSTAPTWAPARNEE